MNTKLQFVPESGGYTVMIGDRMAGQFIGRVKRVRSAYHHSNGRIYRSWSWAAFPPLAHGTYHHRTRKAAGGWLAKNRADGQLLKE